MSSEVFVDRSDSDLLTAKSNSGVFQGGDERGGDQVKFTLPVDHRSTTAYSEAAANEADDDFQSEYTTPAELLALRKMQEKLDQQSEAETAVEEVHLVKMNVTIMGCFPIGSPFFKVFSLYFNKL
jgi:hypothetical protein